MENEKPMTVQDLISILKRMPPKAEILIYCGSEHSERDYQLIPKVEFISEETAVLVFGVRDEVKEEIYQDVHVKDIREIMSKTEKIEESYLYDSEIDEITRKVDDNLAANPTYQQILQDEILKVTDDLYPEAIIQTK